MRRRRSFTFQRSTPASTYSIAPALFDASFAGAQRKRAKGEYYLTDVIGILVSQQRKVGAFKVPHADEILGINTRAELASIDRMMRRRKCEKLMAEGVTIVDPDSTFIDDSVQIAPDTIIYPSVQISGRTVIGEDVTTHSFSRIANAFGSEVERRFWTGCIIVDSSVGDDISVGPFANLRMNTRLENGVKVGNFVEIKKSTLGAGTKSMHLAYLGDATIGKACNIGAGTITPQLLTEPKNIPPSLKTRCLSAVIHLIVPVTVVKGFTSALDPRSPKMSRQTRCWPSPVVKLSKQVLGRAGIKRRLFADIPDSRMCWNL